MLWTPPVRPGTAGPAPEPIVKTANSEKSGPAARYEGQPTPQRAQANRTAALESRARPGLAVAYRDGSTVVVFRAGEQVETRELSA